MLIKSNWAAAGWGVILAICVSFISALLVLLVPVTITDSSSSSPPRIGEIYSKGEIERKELQAKQELGKAREGFGRTEFLRSARDEWARYLPWVIITAFAVIIISTYSPRIISTIVMVLPNYALMIAAEIDWGFIVSTIVALLFFIMARNKWFRQSSEIST